MKLLKVIRFGTTAIFDIMQLWRSLIKTGASECVFFNHSTRIRRVGSRSISTYAHKLYFESSDVRVIEGAVPIHEHDTRKTVIFKERTQNLVEHLGIKLVGNALGARVFVALVAICFIPLLIWQRPRRIIVVVWYARPYLIFAFRKLGFEVWDQQHGLIYREHPYYNPEQITSLGLNPDCVPDVIALYGKYWFDDIANLPWHHTQFVVSGYPVATQIRTSIEAYGRYVLYLPQPGFHATLFEHLENNLQTFRNNGINVVISTHPHLAENTNGYPKGNGVYTSTEDTYSLVAAAEAIYAVSTTLIWEALNFNKPANVIGHSAIGILNSNLSNGLFKLYDDEVKNCFTEFNYEIYLSKDPQFLELEKLNGEHAVQ